MQWSCCGNPEVLEVPTAALLEHVSESILQLSSRAGGQLAARLSLCAGKQMGQAVLLWELGRAENKPQISCASAPSMRPSLPHALI